MRIYACSVYSVICGASIGSFDYAMEVNDSYISRGFKSELIEITKEQAISEIKEFLLDHDDEGGLRLGRRLNEMAASTLKKRMN